MSIYVPAEQRRLVYERAGGRCEYCLVHEDYCVAAHEPDHIVALKHGGETIESNLALACALCNGLKGSDLASVDWQTGKVIRLFQPRTDDWPDHFRLENGLILPTTAIARATVNLLRFNAKRLLDQRRYLIGLGFYP